MRGFLYIISTEKESVFDFDETDFYHLAQNECEWVENSAHELNENCLYEKLKMMGAEAGEELHSNGNRCQYVIFTKEVKQNYFRKNFEKFKEMAVSCDLEKFSTDSLYELRLSIEDPYGDCVYVSGSFMTVERFVREAEENVRYYLGNIITMH